MADCFIMFGVTETYDPAFALECFNNLKEANIIISKYLSDEITDKLVENKEKCILHLTVTGMGGTKIEPNVHKPQWSRKQFEKLIKRFPLEQVVLRVTPIVPTLKGIKTGIEMIHLFPEINRIKYSTLNIKPFIIERFKAIGIKLPYETYSCPTLMRMTLKEALSYELRLWDYTNDKDICAEIDRSERTMRNVGCVTQKDMDILGIKMPAASTGKQRSCCMCVDCKVNIIRKKPQRCPMQCLYCYEPDVIEFKHPKLF